jgi:hypothetical protein
MHRVLRFNPSQRALIDGRAQLVGKKKSPSLQDAWMCGKGCKWGVSLHISQIMCLGGRAGSLVSQITGSSSRGLRDESRDLDGLEVELDQNRTTTIKREGK